MKANGRIKSIAKLKVKAYAQQGVDYDEICALIVKLITIMSMIPRSLNLVGKDIKIDMKSA